MATTVYEISRPEVNGRMILDLFSCALKNNDFIKEHLSPGNTFDLYHDDVSRLLALHKENPILRDDSVANLTIDLIKWILIKVGFTDGMALDLLKSWEKYEDFIFLTRSSYREHFMHQFYNFLLGCLFLEKLATETYTALNTIVRRAARPRLNVPLADQDVYSKRLLRRWVLASLFHDIGYPAQTIADLRKSLNANFFDKIPNWEVPSFELHRVIRNKDSEHVVEDDISGLIEKMAYIHLFSEFAMVNDKEYSTFTKKNEEMLISKDSRTGLAKLFADEVMHSRDHGIMGALFFLETALIDLREVSFAPKQSLKRDFQELRTFFTEDSLRALETDIFVAASAIAGHNLRAMTYPGYTADFCFSPIACLLNLCDDLQEWDRQPNDPDWLQRGISHVEIKFRDLDEFRVNLDYTEKGVAIIAGYQRHFLGSLDLLFSNNLRDKYHVFYKEITVALFSCGRIFRAIRDDETGRYDAFMVDNSGQIWHSCSRDEVSLDPVDLPGGGGAGILPAGCFRCSMYDRMRIGRKRVKKGPSPSSPQADKKQKGQAKARKSG